MAMVEMPQGSASELTAGMRPQSLSYLQKGGVLMQIYFLRWLCWADPHWANSWV